jgi:soluble lytic murein transglycosylase-like protein
LFPVPRWKPRDGFIVDRALIYAFVRQESGFNTRARSHAGARGLMQLMPGTASFVSRSTFKGKKRDNLYDPELNLSLGQRYLIHLLEHDSVQGDLLLLAAAYNGGPGNLGRLQDRSAQPYDPLLFVESIPVRETRLFVGRVLSNLWIYQQRLGQPTPSLEALAAGERPIYSNQEARQSARVTTRNVRN